MTLPVLIAISIMWFPLALFFLGKGEAKRTGAICGMVGIVVILGAILQAAIFKVKLSTVCVQNQDHRSQTDAAVAEYLPKIHQLLQWA